MRSASMELIYIVFKYLDCVGQTAVGLTCKDLFKTLYYFASTSSKRHSNLCKHIIVDLLDVEQWPV